MKKYIVRLTISERDGLKRLVKKGKAAAYKRRHANILLLVDAGDANWKDEQVAQAVGCHKNTVGNVRQRFVEQGLDAALDRKKQDRMSREPIIDGDVEAQVIKIACGRPPKGRKRWTLELLAGKLIQLKVVKAVSDETVRRALKKTNLSLTCVSVG